jgi:hypothetical protein
VPWRPYLGQRHWRVRYVLANSFELAIALAAVVAGVTLLLDSHALAQTSVGRGVQGLAPVWSVLYSFGGAGMIGGLLWPSVRAEIAGICLFVPALLTDAAAVWLYAGVNGVAPMTTYLTVAAAACARAWCVMRAYRKHGRL